MRLFSVVDFKSRGFHTCTAVARLHLGGNSSYRQYWKKVVICCEVNHCQYLSSTACFIRVFQHGFLLVTLRLVDCLTGLHVGITCEGNRRILVVSEINNNSLHLL